MNKRIPTRLYSQFNKATILKAIKEGLIAVKVNSNNNFHLLNYTDRAQYSKVWNKEIKASRGLIISESPDNDPYIIARPFPKFANMSEHQEGSTMGPLPIGLDVEITEKVDGSLVIMYFDNEGVQFATRGSFESEQAKMAKLWLLNNNYMDLIDLENIGEITVLFEYVAPWNRIVIPYDKEELIYLGAIDIATGADVEVQYNGRKALKFEGLNDLEKLNEVISKDGEVEFEGYVVRFIPEVLTEPSTRVKAKFSEYVRLHKLATGLSTVTIWEALSAGMSLDELIQDLPDELHDFIKEIVNGLTQKHQKICDAAKNLAAKQEGKSRKDAALDIMSHPEISSALVFFLLDNKPIDNKAWTLLKPELRYP
jgi:RNA ligase